MGYIHDVNMIAVLPPELCQVSDTQAWSDAVSSNVWSRNRAAGATSFVLKVPVFLPQNSAAQRGAYFRSVEIWWEVTTDALTSLAAAIYEATLPANGDAFGAPALQAVAYDTGHDTAGERITADQHKMTLSLATPIWLDDDDLVYLEISVTAPATSVFKYYGARLTYTLRL